MPAGFIPNEGLADTLSELLGRVAIPPTNWQLLFWVNDFTPDFDVTLDDLEEAGWVGYSRLWLNRDQWTVPVVNDGCAHATWKTTPTVWQVTGGPVQTVYGLAYLDFATSKLRFIQRFDEEDITPIEVPGTVSVLPEYRLTIGDC